MSAAVPAACTVVAGTPVATTGPSPGITCTSKLTAIPSNFRPASNTYVKIAPTRTIVSSVVQSPILRTRVSSNVTVVASSVASPQCWLRAGEGQWKKFGVPPESSDTAKDDDFELLPPPLVDFKNESAARQRGTSMNSEDGFELDVDDFNDYDFTKDTTMVRSPDGMHWVKTSRKFQLDTAYSIWFNAMPKGGKKRRGEEQYEESLQCVGTVTSVQDFWRYWNAIDLERIADFSSLSVFKNPIKPMWEDPKNKDGGEWVLRCNSRHEAEGFFTKMVLALIGGYFDCHENLCGVVMSTKPKLTSLGLWNGAMDNQELAPINYELRELLSLENDEKHVMEYKAHQSAVRVESQSDGTGTTSKG